MSIKNVVNFVKLLFVNYTYPEKLIKNDVLGSCLFPNGNVMLVAYIEEKTIIVKLGSYIGATWNSSINQVIRNGDTMAANVAKALYLTHCSATLPNGVTWQKK